MRAARGCAQQLLLPASAGICGGTRASDVARPDFHRSSSLRQPPAAGGAVAGGGFSWPPTHPAADAEARAVGGQAEAEHQQAASHKVYPYLLRGKTIDQPNQGWAADITYIAMLQGFLYLVPIFTWPPR